ncbi:MAG: glycosyltransferase family 2 protein [Desulfomonile tiedjei]|nr:glycosyltransferase family 2 protein [Desulfomonile tiedjei]
MVNVVRLGKNLGSKALWIWGDAKKLVRPPFVYTDSDIVPTEGCPKDLIEFLLRAAETFASPNKIGLGLRIDDLPDHYALRSMVQEWESQYWQKQIGELDGVPIYSAYVDTTFALYPEFKIFSLQGIRTGFPYVARHLPWYLNSEQISEEESFYEQHASKSFHNWGANNCYSQAVKNRCKK